MLNKIIIGSLFLMLVSSSVFSALFHGQLNVEIFDNFEANSSKILYQLEDGNNSYTLDLPNTIDKNQLITGLTVTIVR